MKFIISCPECGHDIEAAEVVIGNDPIHEVLCDFGHKNNIFLVNQKHELLFEIAAQAIVDGYYREAISSFSASLERYYEFFIKVIHQGIGPDALDKAWKHVASQSERQLGAYIFTYLNVFNNSPEILEKKAIELRNKVIHKGHIPSRDEAVNYGKKVASIIQDGCNILHDRCNGKLEAFYSGNIPSNTKLAKHVILDIYLGSLSVKELALFEEYLVKLQTHNMP